MNQTVRDVMTTDPQVLDNSVSLQHAAQTMRANCIGDVLVADDGGLCGILTDRDIVLRGVAEGHDLAQTTIGEICTHDVLTLADDSPVDTAVEMMRTHGIRRLPVVSDGKAVGIVSLGDLAMERDPESALGEISAQPANGG